MLKEILSQSSCAKCRICCIFDESDMWEMPSVDDQLKEYISEQIDSKQKYIEKNNYRIFKPGTSDKNGLMECPMLGEKGCRLGDRKPFDCRVWPFRVMDFKGHKVITVSPVCETVSNLALSQLTAFISGGLGETMFEKAREGKISVKPYIENYPILMTEK